MNETPEGIGSRKWSFKDRLNALNPDELVLCQGVLELATLTKIGGEYKNLIVTAPQLWSAGNEMVLHALKCANGDYSKLDLHVIFLAEMVAKSVGKQEFSKVAQ